MWGKVNELVDDGVVGEPQYVLVERQDQIGALIDAVRHDKPVSCNGEDGKWSVVMCLATQRSIETGLPVAMNEIF